MLRRLVSRPEAFARLSAALIAVALVGAEVVLRDLGYGRRLRLEESERYGLVLLPDQTAYAPRSPVPVRINSAGFRGPEWGPPSAADESVLRIALLGHSMTMGGWEPLEATYGGVLQRELGRRLERRGDSRRVLVMNWASPGLTLPDMRAVFEDRVRPYRPDYLVIPTLAVDVQPPRPIADATSGPIRRLYVRTALYDFLTRRSKRPPVDRAPLTADALDRWRGVGGRIAAALEDPFDPTHVDLWEAYYATVEGMVETQSNDGGRTVLLGLPDRRDLDPPSGWERIGARNGAWAAGRAGLVAVDAVDALVVDGEAADDYFNLQGHYSRRAHRRIGTALTAAIDRDLATRRGREESR